MNKIQIKAEILATLTALMTSTQPQASLITDLKNIDDKKILMVKRDNMIYVNDCIVKTYK